MKRSPKELIKLADAGKAIGVKSNKTMRKYFPQAKQRPGSGPTSPFFITVAELERYLINHLKGER